MRTQRLCLIALALSLFAAACAPGASAENINLKILPQDCSVQAGGQVALSLSGQIPAGLQINWSATAGNVVWTGQGLAATFIAPAEAGVATITVTFVSGTPSPFSFSRDCLVINGGARPSTGGAFTHPNRPTLVISEVMANVCGGLELKKYNQYIELYNYGETAVDVNGMYFFDEGESGTPDQLVPWVSRSPFALDPGLIVNTTLIPPHGFALVLSPQYAQGPPPHRMPYLIPAGTIILTIASSDTLGDDLFGIIAADNGSDTLTLYRGGLTVMDAIIDAYGTPFIAGPHPNDSDINDDFNDHLPLVLSECQSAERINPLVEDMEGNWDAVPGGTPGDGPYP
ncbi:MAG: hypothetical protein HFACDABA_02566 [Anaerolineales bacterium]|nr:hypothetical protein [Anaerolineales bacterium]